MLWCTLGAEFRGMKELPEVINNQALWDFFQGAYEVYMETPNSDMGEAFMDYMEKPVPIK